MKKLVFDKEEVVHIDNVTLNNLIIGYKGGIPVVTIFKSPHANWSYYGNVGGYCSGSMWESANDLLTELMKTPGITEFYVV